MWTELHTESVRDFYEYKCPCCLSDEGAIHEDECPFRMVASLSWLLHAITFDGPQCSDCGFWLPPDIERYGPVPEARCRRCRMRCEHCGELDSNIMQHVIEVNGHHTIFRVCEDCSTMITEGKQHHDDMMDALSLREAL